MNTHKLQVCKKCGNPPKVKPSYGSVLIYCEHCKQQRFAIFDASIDGQASHANMQLWYKTFGIVA